MSAINHAILDLIEAASGQKFSREATDVIGVIRDFMRSRSPASTHFRTLCLHAILAAKNFDYNIDSNGERWLLRQIARFNPSVIFDVGANHGDWTKTTLDLCPSCQIHSFEIVPGTFDVLFEFFRSNSRVKLNNFGLSDSCDTVGVHVYESNILSSIFNYPHGPSKLVNCSVKRGDSYANENNIEHIDLLKIDTEGAEGLVISGFSDLLVNRRISVVQFEYGRANILAKIFLKDIYEIFKKFNFSVGKLYWDGVEFKDYNLDDEDFVGPNFVACSNNHLHLIDALRRPNI